MKYQDYIPEEAIPLVQDLIEQHNFTLKIVHQRQTKHGDFRKLPNDKFQITINNNLNKEQFLLTLIHEIAHHIVYQKFRRGSASWKRMENYFSAFDVAFFKTGSLSESYIAFISELFKKSEGKYRYRC